MRHAVAQLVETLRCKPEGRRVRFPMVSLEFFIDIILPAALWALLLTQHLDRNEYQGYFLGGKGGRA
jgi:hypothetical protein